MGKVEAGFGVCPPKASQLLSSLGPNFLLTLALMSIGQ